MDTNIVNAIIPFVTKQKKKRQKVRLYSLIYF